VCVGEILSSPWFYKELKNNLSKNNWLYGVILILFVHESIFIRWGFPFPIVLVSRYKLYLCHTPIKPDLLGFPGISVFTCALRDHEVCIIWYRSLAPLIRLYPSEICVSYYFRKNTLVSNFFFSLNLRHIKKLLFHFVTVQNISVASKKKRKERRKEKKQIVQKDIYWFPPQKTKQGKIRSNQFEISSNLIL